MAEHSTEQRTKKEDKGTELTEARFFPRIKAAREKLEEYLANFLDKSFSGSGLSFTGASPAAYDRLKVAFDIALQSGVTSTAILAHIKDKYESDEIIQTLAEESYSQGRATTLQSIKDTLLLASGGSLIWKVPANEEPQIAEAVVTRTRGVG